MKTELELTLRLLSPIALHRTRASVQYVESLDYIPGMALCGALAELYMSEYGEADDDIFQNLFVSGQVQFGDLWPTRRSGMTNASVLLPATVQACKRYGLAHRDSFHDTLLDVFVESELLECEHVDNGNGSKCGEPLDRISGYLSDLDGMEKIAAKSALRVNTAIDRSTGTAAREMLFSQHTLTSESEKPELGDICFQGILRVADSAIKAPLNDLLKANSTFFLGSGRTRGLGEVTVERFKPAEPRVSLEERWEGFNDAAHKAGGDANYYHFSLTFLSHVALRDGILRPVLGDIAPHDFGLPEGVEFVHRRDSNQPVCFLNQTTLHGWNSAQGLPKPDTVALTRGSVLLFKCPNGLRSEVLRRLTQIEAEGIGERRGQGFGRIAVCYPVHYQSGGRDT